MIEKIRAYVWMFHNFGFRKTWRYGQVRRSGFLLNWMDVLTPEEMAVMEEHFEDVPWKGMIIRPSRPSINRRRSRRRIDGE